MIIDVSDTLFNIQNCFLIIKKLFTLKETFNILFTKRLMKNT